MKALTLLALVGCAAPARPTPHTRTVFVGATVIPAPDAAPIADAALVIEDGRIAAVGPRAAVRVPDNADVVDVHGATITAGFWNSHVHFTEPTWASAAAGPLAAGLRDMLTRWGFTHVVDTGSTLA
jgi:cytosine/adenosine deaminase-related metal-dependent hydrolase